MKKFLITILLIGSLGGYAMYKRKGDDESVGLTPPSQVSATPAEAPATPVDNSSGSSSATHTSSSSQTSVSNNSGQYKNGTYTGSVEDAFYGNIQVQATVAGGKLTAVKFLQYPNDRHESVQINSQADPWLSQEAIVAQSSNVDIISGATDSSEAFIRSLTRALDQAKA